MIQTISGLIRRPSGLDGLFANADSLTAEIPPPADVLVGFDAVVQCSRDLLQAAVGQSLNTNGLATLAAQTPLDPSATPPKLRAAVAAFFKFGGLFQEHRLEVRLIGPHLVSLSWPPPPPPGSGGEVEDAGATALIQPRRVTVGWQFEVNILVSKFPDTVSQFTGTQPLPTTTGPVLSQDRGTSGGPSFDRVPIGKGQATTAAIAEIRLVRTRFQFGVVMAFADELPVVSSDDPLVTEFLASSLCQDLLAQAAGPLLSADRISLTPTIAPGGPLNAEQVKPLHPAAFKVRDVLLTDAQGAPVLCLCLDIGSAQGVLGLVQPFLDRTDFGYAASMNLLAPALKARWSAVSRGATFINEVPVELAVSEGSEETATGRARVQITFSRTLKEATIRASDTDVLRLVADQTIQLLGLWDHRGKQITDLGPLADPKIMPFVLALDLFSALPPNAPLPPSSALGDFIGSVLLFSVYPLLQRFRVKAITGYTSSATQTLLSRWPLKGLLDDVRGPGGTTVKGDR